MAAGVIGDGRPDGNTFGSATTEYISFYGVTTVTQPTNAAQAALTLTTTVSGGFGFGTSAAMVAMTDQLENIRASLVTLGLIKGS